MRRVFCEPTQHVAAAKVHAAANGLGVLGGVLSRAEVQRIRLAVWREVEVARADNEPLTDPTDPEAASIHLPNLVSKDPVFRELVEHPTAIDIVTHLLGSKFRLANFFADIPGPGARATGMRADQGYVTPPWPAWPLSVTMIWVIDQFTAENGAIRVMPDSVRYGHGPEWGLPYPEAEPLTCNPGSIIAIDGRIWHQNGANTTEKQWRIALLARYVRPFILPEIEWRDVVPPDVRETLTPGLREMLGFGARATRHSRTRHGRQMWLDDPGPEL